jgi:exodeoxyribonuclease-3
VRLVSWNVNGIRARISRIQNFLERHDPDIVCLQETKVEDGGVPFFAFPEHTLTAYGQKSYNGVAFLSKVAPDEVKRGFTNDPVPDQKRCIAGRWGNLWVVNLYCVNGKDPEHEAFGIKQQWFTALRKWLDHQFDAGREILLTGDFNVTPADIDSHDPEGRRGHIHHTVEERRWLTELMEFGLTDLHRQITPDQVWTWWDYRALAFPQDKGLRIDLSLGTPAVAQRLENVWVDRDERRKSIHPDENPSDHAPLVTDLE